MQFPVRSRMPTKYELSKECSDIWNVSYIELHFSSKNAEFGGLKFNLARWIKPMKSENQIIGVRRKQPIKCLLLFSYRVGKVNNLQTVLLSLFSIY